MSYAEALDWLARNRDDSGAWGYLPGQPPAGEPTVLAAAAGAGVAADWLDRDELGWPTLLLPAALVHEPHEALRDRAVQRILARSGGTVSATPGSYRGDLVGWSWVPHTFSWVEPTAWGVLSLRCAGAGENRVNQGLAVLADRQCEDGGWNVGTPDILGTKLQGWVYATAWVVLALPAGPVAQRGLQFLSGPAEPSTMSLSLAILARLAHGRDAADLVPHLLARQAPDGGFSGRADRTALAACAMRAAEVGTRPFEVRVG